MIYSAKELYNNRHVISFCQRVSDGETEIPFDLYLSLKQTGDLCIAYQVLKDIDFELDVDYLSKKVKLLLKEGK